MHYNIFENETACVLYQELMKDFEELDMEIQVPNDILITVDMMRTFLKLSHIRRYGTVPIEQ